MSILICMAKILPFLDDEDQPRAVYQGLLHVARECAGKPPRFTTDPLPAGETRPEVFKKRFRNFIEVRDDEGAERCRWTAIDLGMPSKEIADMVFAAATDHIYLDAGHVVDYANKAFELLGHLGRNHAGWVLTSLVHGMAGAERSQELSSWRQPVDIASLVWEARDELPALYEEGQRKVNGWRDEEQLAQVMLSDSPVSTLGAIKEAIKSGAPAEALGSSLAYAAFLRIAHFHVSNEFRDWDTVHNTLTAAKALHQALKRAPSVELLSGVFDIAMSIYLDRFLNMPPQRIPETGNGPVDDHSLVSELLERMEVRRQVDEVAQIVSQYLTGAGEPETLLATLGQVMLMEDSRFHSLTALSGWSCAMYPKSLM